MNFFISLIIALLFSIFPLISMFKKKKEKSYYLISFIILLIGCFCRLFLIDKYPVGLNQDEASIGYEAYSLIQNGTDRNGFSYPVNLVAWGSGQNVLYAYLSMPFIKLLGLNILSTRIVMALIGCLTLLVIYLFTSKQLKHKHSLIVLLMLAIMPWHLTKSRFGLESNIFPDLILYAVILLYLGFKKHKKKYYFFSSIILGISTYAYGTSYLFVPILFFVIYGYLLKKKQIRWHDLFINLFIIFIISLPLIIFVFINFFNLNTIKIGPITIPKLNCNRMKETTIINSNHHNLNQILSNTSALVYMIIGDIYSRNYSYYHIPFFGLYYYISIPFLFYGIYKAFKSENQLIKFVNMYLIACLPVALFIFPTSVHLNIILIPILFYVCYGIILMIEKKKKFYFIPFTYLIIFSLFIGWYFTGYQKNLEKEETVSLEDALKYTKKNNYQKIYITDNINQPYIYYLFYNKIDNKYYLENRKISDENQMFQKVDQIGNVYFKLPKKEEKNTLIIVDNNDKVKYSCKYRKLKKYTIYFC